MDRKRDPKRKSPPVDAEKKRSMVLHSKGFVLPFMVNEDLRQSRFFIDTMERFIADSERDEVDSLKEQTESMTDDEKDDFWQNNFPVHWNEVFGVRIRSSFCTQLCSQIEATLSSISDTVRILSRSPISFKEIKGNNVLDQHRRYLEAFGNFAGISDASWKEVGHMFLIRNVHVHEQGYFGKHAKNQDFLTFLNGLPKVKTRSDFIELEAGSCPAFLDIAQRFQDDLFAEYQELRERLVALEAS